MEPPPTEPESRLLTSVVDDTPRSSISTETSASVAQPSALLDDDRHTPTVSGQSPTLGSDSGMDTHSGDITDMMTTDSGYSDSRECIFKGDEQGAEGGESGPSGLLVVEEDKNDSERRNAAKCEHSEGNLPYDDDERNVEEGSRDGAKGYSMYVDVGENKLGHFGERESANAAFDVDEDAFERVDKGAEIKDEVDVNFGSSSDYDVDDEHNITDDGRMLSEDDSKSLDVLLLEEICEEAANMTIKEALIHSLKPNVRAGLTSGHFQLSESEILALERYCEDFVDGLIKELLKQSSLLGAVAMGEGGDTRGTSPSDIKRATIQLSRVNLLELRLNCDHFVHNIIAESMIDSSIITAKAHAEERENLNNSQALKELLSFFQESEEIQEYFSNLTSDIVRTALDNMSKTKTGVKADTPTVIMEGFEDQKLMPFEEETDPESHDEFNHFHDGFRGDLSRSSSRDDFPIDQDFEEFDDEYGYRFTNPSGSTQVKVPFKTSSTGEPVREGDGNQINAYPSLGVQSMTSEGGEMSLEFDMDWIGGVLHDLKNIEGDRKQKIVVRELEFDEYADVGGTELLAPVFLAVAEDNEDDSEFQGMRRKTQSIEDLCDMIEEKEPFRGRSQSLDLKNRMSGPQTRAKSYQGHIQWMGKDSFDEAIDVATDPVSLVPEDGHEMEFDSEVELEARSYSDSDQEREMDSELEPEMVSEQESEPEPEVIEQEPEPEAKESRSQEKEDRDHYRWHTVRVNTREKVLDLKLLEPYMKVITHGGFHSPERAVIVVITACYLPEKTHRNYDFIMEQVFFYLISTLELLATTDEFYVVYFNGGTTQSNMPALTWMKRFYQHIEGGLKKNMIHMYIVHPNFWLKTVVRVAKAFVSTNFWNKLHFIKSLKDLSKRIPIEYIYIPDEVVRSDPHYKRVHNL